MNSINHFHFLDMDFEFLVRTADNVEIILDVSIFWQIIDLYKLVLITEDPPQDICKLNDECLNDVTILF